MHKLNYILFFAAVFFRAGCLQASTFTSTQNLSFGTLIPTASSGSVTISTAGAINTGGSVTVAPSGTAYYQGLMTFTGTGLGVLLDVVTITVLDSSVTLTGSNGGTVTVNNFVTNNSISVNLASPTVSNIPLGGTMTFTSASVGGNYTGTVRVRGSGLLSGTATATVPITLTLWNALTVTAGNPLNFGAIERVTGNSVIRVNPQTGARTVVSGAGGVNLINSPTSTAGQFNISGQPNVNISISLPSSMTLTRSGGGGTMTVNNFTGYPSATSTTLDGTGARALGVGADLTVAAGQTSGTYTGTYTVTINY